MTGQNPWIGKTLGDCRIEKFIGSGAMSEVYLAYYNKLGISVALKIMNFVHESEEKSKKFQRRFQQELKFVSNLNHPNIVKVYGGGEDHGYWYMIMEYVPGMTLMKLIETQGHLSIQETLFFLQEIVSALKVSHEQGIIHRDIKPGNILITESGHCKLTDFGLAKGMNSNSSISQKGNIVGTIFYMSPEQTMGSKNVDYRADYYSLGVTLFQMVTGKLPFPGRTPLQVIQQHLACKVPSAKELNSEVTDEIEHLIFKMMEKKPENRFSSTKSILKAIDQCYHSKPKFLEKHFIKLRRIALVLLIITIFSIVSLIIYQNINFKSKNNPSKTENNIQNTETQSKNYRKTKNKDEIKKTLPKQEETESQYTTLKTLKIIPDKVQLHPNEHCTFKVQAFNDWNVQVDCSPYWIPFGGTINENGEFTAGNKEGKYILSVRDQKTLTYAQATIEIIDSNHPKGWFGEIMPKGMIKNNVLGEYIWEKDNSIMMYIPEGEFWSGDNQGEDDEKPAQSIYLDGYYLDKFELTYEQYQRYCKENKIEIDTQTNLANHPVVNISWTEANNYAKWVGKRLPSEAEWEKAARGGEKIPNWIDQTPVPLITNPFPRRTYPWGNLQPHNNANTHNNANGFFCNYVAYDDITKRDEDGYSETAPVGSFLDGQSPYGIQDMAGNVCEWCQDKYDATFYKKRFNRNPISQEVGNTFVVRGGSWHHYAESCYTFRRSSQPNERFNYTGVRFAR